ncbi:hypothetical protein LOTGIDRAFT_83596, partial [Lottia gigantea]
YTVSNRLTLYAYFSNTPCQTNLPYMLTSVIHRVKQTYLIFLLQNYTVSNRLTLYVYFSNTPCQT